MILPVFLVTEGNKTYCTIYYSEDLQPLLTKLKTPPTIRATVSDKFNSYTADTTRTVSFFPLFVAKEKQLRLAEEKQTAYIQVSWSEKMDSESKKKLDIVNSEPQIIVKRVEPGEALPVDKRINDTTDYYSVSLVSGMQLTPFLNQRVVLQHRDTGQQVCCYTLNLADCILARIYRFL